MSVWMCECVGAQCKQNSRAARPARTTGMSRWSEREIKGRERVFNRMGPGAANHLNDDPPQLEPEQENNKASTHLVAWRGRHNTQGKGT